MYLYSSVTLINDNVNVLCLQNARFDQIQVLLDTFHKECRVEFDEAQITERYPFISIEGPEASGKRLLKTDFLNERNGSMFVCART